MKRFAFSSFLFLICSVLSGQTPKRDALKEYNSGNYNAAVSICLDELETYTLRQVSRRMDSYSVLCWSLLALQRYDDVERYGNAALQVNSSDLRIIEVLGEAYYYKGEEDKALMMMEDYAARLPGSFSTPPRIGYVYYIMGLVYRDREEWNQAYIAFKSAIAYGFVIGEWLYELGKIEIELGKTEDARATLSQALGLVRDKERVRQTLDVLTSGQN